MGYPNIIVAKLNWSKFYQGEEPEPEGKLSGGDNFERYTFRRSTDGYFYGSIPKFAPKSERKWLLLFIGRAPRNAGHYAVGWYENAVFQAGRAPEYARFPGLLSESEIYGGEFTSNVQTKEAYLLPWPIRFRFKSPPLEHFESAIYIYAREDGKSRDNEHWRQDFADFAERVISSKCDK